MVLVYYVGNIWGKALHKLTRRSNLLECKFLIYFCIFLLVFLNLKIDNVQYGVESRALELLYFAYLAKHYWIITSHRFSEIISLQYQVSTY